MSRWPLWAIRVAAALAGAALPSAAAAPEFLAEQSMPPRWLGDRPDRGKVSRDALPLRVRGRSIVSAGRDEVRLWCVNWYGAHLRQSVLNGLDVQPVTALAQTIAQMGFNCVRLPFSLDNLYDRTVPHADTALRANPALQGRSPLEVFDSAVESLTSAGLMVILNDHASAGGWCCSDDDGEGFWYTQAYPEAKWLEALGTMAARYQHNALVVGFDLRNELRHARGRAPSWGSNVSATDWAAASVRGAEAVLAKDKDMLIFVSGLDYSMYLCDVPTVPVHTQVPLLKGRVVYTTHEYGWYFSDLGVFRDVAEKWLWLYLFALASSFMLTALVLQARRSRGVWRVAEALSKRSPALLRCLGLDVVLEPSSVGARSLLLRFATAVVSTVSVLGAVVYGQSIANPCGKRSDIWVLCTASLGAACCCSLAAWSWFLLLAARLGQSARTIHPKDLPPQLSVADALAPNSGGDAGHIELSPTAGRRTARAGGAVAEAAPLATPQWGHQNGGLEPRPASGGGRAPRGPGASGCGRTAVLAAALATAGLLGAVAAAAAHCGSYEAFEGELTARWAFLADPSRADVAPIWLGEFGTGENSRWWRHMVRFLREHPHIGWAYWAVNGKKRIDEDESFGLLMQDELSVRHWWKLRDLQSLMAA